jgi:hypothetical protein
MSHFGKVQRASSIAFAKPKLSLFRSRAARRRVVVDIPTAKLSVCLVIASATRRIRSSVALASGTDVAPRTARIPRLDFSGGGRYLYFTANWAKSNCKNGFQRAGEAIPGNQTVVFVGGRPVARGWLSDSSIDLRVDGDGLRARFFIGRERAG